MMRTMAIATVAVCFVLGASTAWGNDFIVDTATGPVRGVQEDGVRVFKGIPYAAPPVGDLRWKPPQAAQPWDGARDASEFGADCQQLPYAKGSLYYRDPRPQSEDCLCLNVWTDAKPGEARPVMVWIHGGALTRGSGATPTYNGAHFARNGVVLVTINYRLNVFGYFSHPGLSAESPEHASGNYGVLDQIAALRWVQENIEGFGGDPDRVTIFGESAGSWSVCSLMATPLSAGLFQRAIGESGGVFSPMSYLNEERFGQESAESVGLRFAAAAGAESVEALRAMSSEDVVKTFSEAAPGEGYATRGVVDGWVFPREVRLTFAQGAQHDVPVIVGSNKNEMTSLIAPTRIPKTVEQLRAYVAQTYGERADEFFETYPVKSDADAAEALLASARDRSFSWQMRTWARRMEKVESPAYQYFFTREPPIENAAYYRSYHASEIAYVFGNLREDRGYGASDRELSDTVAAYWMNFAATGDPNGEGLPVWSPYTSGTESYMELGDVVSGGSHLLRKELDFMDRAMEDRVRE